MDNPKLILFAALGAVGLFFIVMWVRALAAGRAVQNGPDMPTPLQTTIGFVTNFFDTLGIGSYAPTTALFRFFGQVPDEKIPGTLTLGHVLPTIVQSFIFIAIVQVDFKTLVLLIGASIVGAWLVPSRPGSEAGAPSPADSSAATQRRTRPRRSSSGTGLVR